MEPERWERVTAIYHAALQKGPGERASFLEYACRDDRELLREVESLLAQGSGNPLLERPAWQSADSIEGEPESAEAHGAPARRHPFCWVVRVTLAGMLSVLAYETWRVPQDVADFGWRGARRGAGFQIVSVDPAGPAAGKLQPGDRLLTLNGDANVARVGSTVYRLFLGIGEHYRIQVSQHGITKEYVLALNGRDPHLRARLSNFLTGLVWCAVALFIGFARPQDGLARLAFGAASLTGLMVFHNASNLPVVAALSPLHTVLGYHFFYWFPAGAPRARIWRALLWLLYLAAAVCAALGLWRKLLLYAAGPKAATAWVAGPLHRLLLPLRTAAYGIAMLGAVALALQKYRAVVDLDQRRRFQWVAFGGVVGLAPAALWGVLNLLSPGRSGVPEWLMAPETWEMFGLGVNACSAAVPLSVAYAVVRHRVFDVRVAIRRGIQYLLAKRALQVLLAFPSAALLFTLLTHRRETIQELATGTKGYLFWLLALGLSLRFRSPLARWLDQRFFREQYDREQVALNLVDDLTRFDSVEEMTGFVFQQLERSFHPKSMYLWWREAREMRLAYSSDPGLVGASCPITTPLLERLGAVARAPLPEATGVTRAESRWLAKRGIRLIVPLVGMERLDGVLMLGEKQSEEPYGAVDERLLHSVARQTAVIRDSLRLKGQVIDEQRVRHEVLAKLDQSLVDLLRECPVCGACFDSSAQTCDRDGSALTLTLPVPRTIDGKYRLEQLIGRGGMGAVYEAHDLGLGRQVAIKIMLGGGFGHETALRRFRREAQAVARLNHPNIISLYDFGELEGGGAYLVMERLRGVTLRTEMKRVGVFAPEETAGWFEQILDGLAAAHERGIIHRDLKPENILASRQPSGPLVVKILDFGLAKSLPLAAGAPASQSLTESGVVLGTLAYMAPEQFAGTGVDQRADLYAAGVVLVEMLTGHRPFEDSPNLRTEYHLPLDFPNQPALDAVVQRCLATAPELRNSSAAELHSALIPALRGCGAGRRSHLN